MSVKTLAQLQACPLRKASAVTVNASTLAEVIKASNLNNANANPDHEAMSFYALNQAVAAIQGKFTNNEQLPEWAAAVVSAYKDTLYSQYRRMMHYTFLVISREWRHLKNLKTCAAKNKEMEPLYKLMVALHPNIADSTSVTSLNNWLTQVPDVSLDIYGQVLMHSFDAGSWSGGYGGKPWGMIARTFHRHAIGETSAEVFIDTAYTLAHNNGPMFNKGMLYGSYSSQFYKILDVQRSGQVCEGLLNFELKGAPSTLLGLIQATAEALPECFGKYVDWVKVEDLGSLHKYHSEKAQQLKLYGKPVPTGPILVDGQPVKVKGTFEWFPGKTVKIIERMAA